VDSTAIYRKTAKGQREVDERASGLEKHVRRLLILIDGQRSTAELSVYIRAGEFESTLGRLLGEGFVEAAGPGDFGPGGVPRTPAADDPVVFAGIKIRAIGEIRSQMRGRFAPMADLMIADINACRTALALREKLRGFEEALVRLVGEEEGVALARRIGGELTRLTPEG
jgi:hypothetical protein